MHEFFQCEYCIFEVDESFCIYAMRAMSRLLILTDARVSGTHFTDLENSTNKVNTKVLTICPLGKAKSQMYSCILFIAVRSVCPENMVR